jgi:hypothetical protein
MRVQWMILIFVQFTLVMAFQQKHTDDSRNLVNTLTQKLQRLVTMHGETDTSNMEVTTDVGRSEEPHTPTNTESHTPTNTEPHTPVSEP